MKDIFKQLFLFFLVVLLNSCMSTDKEEGTFTDESFQLSYKINNGKYLDVGKATLLNPSNMVYHPKGYLIFSDSQSDYLVKIININTGTVQKIVRKGRGPNESINIANISIVNNDVWLHGSSLRKMLKLKMDSLGVFHIVEELNMGVQAGRFVALTDDLFVGTPYSKERVAYFNRKGELLHSAGGFPKDIRNGEGILPNIVFQTGITASPDGKYVALANLSIDVLEVYSDKGDTVCILSGPDGFKTNVKPHDEGAGRTFPLDPFFFAYRDIKALDKEIWASYAGIELVKGEIPNPIKTFPKKIYCFSWKGEPIRKIELDVRFLSFAIDSKNMKLYCLVNEPEIRVIEYDISEFKI